MPTYLMFYSQECLIIDFIISRQLYHPDICDYTLKKYFLFIYQKLIIRGTFKSYVLHVNDPDKKNVCLAIDP